SGKRLVPRQRLLRFSARERGRRGAAGLRRCRLNRWLLLLLRFLLLLLLMLRKPEEHLPHKQHANRQHDREEEIAVILVHVASLLGCRFSLEVPRALASIGRFSESDGYPSGRSWPFRFVHLDQRALEVS